MHDKISTQSTLKAEPVELSSFGVKLRISVPQDLETRLLRKSSMYFPIDGSEKIALKAQPIEVTVKRGEPRISIQDSHAIFVSNSGDDSIVADALLITSRLLEKTLNQNGIFTLHASGVSYNGKAILLLGSYGSGKTTTALNICINDKEIGYITGNRPYIQMGDNKVVYGMGHVSLGTSSLVEELHIGNDYLKKIGFDPSHQTPYQAIHASRTYFDYSVLDITRATFPLDLKAVILIKKSPRELVSFKLDAAGDKEKRAIYSALREYSEKNYVMIGPKLILPDITTDVEKRTRLDYAVQLAGSIQFLYAEGTLNALTSFISSFLKGLH